MVGEGSGRGGGGSRSGSGSTGQRAAQDGPGWHAQSVGHRLSLSPRPVPPSHPPALRPARPRSCSHRPGTQPSTDDPSETTFPPAPLPRALPSGQLEDGRTSLLALSSPPSPRLRASLPPLSILAHASDPTAPALPTPRSSMSIKQKLARRLSASSSSPLSSPASNASPPPAALSNGHASQPPPLASMACTLKATGVEVTVVVDLDEVRIVKRSGNGKGEQPSEHEHARGSSAGSRRVVRLSLLPSAC